MEIHVHKPDLVVPLLNKYEKKLPNTKVAFIAHIDFSKLLKLALKFSFKLV